MSIEQFLNQGMSSVEIGRTLNRDPSGIRKELKSYSSYFGSRKICELCLNRDKCAIGFLCKDIRDYEKCSSCKDCEKAAVVCKDYRLEIDCKILDRIHVCNGCDRKEECEVTYRYIAYQTILKHEASQNRSHIPLKFKLLPQEYLDYLSDRICAGISPDIILNRLPKRFIKYRISVPTLYSYIDK